MSDKNIVIQVNLHAILRTLAQAGDGGTLNLSLPADARAVDILPLLNLPAMEVVYSVNSMIVDANTPLKDGDRVDVIPAISGG